jgi:putative transposase
MTNHVHLLLTPSAPGRLSAAMRQLGQGYVPAFNRRDRRTGTLWEGRFKSCLVDSERYLLAVHRNIELNPVRAAMTPPSSTTDGPAHRPASAWPTTRS